MSRCTAWFDVRGVNRAQQLGFTLGPIFFVISIEVKVTKSTKSPLMTPLRTECCIVSSAMPDTASHRHKFPSESRLTNLPSPIFPRQLPFRGGKRCLLALHWYMEDIEDLCQLIYTTGTISPSSIRHLGYVRSPDGTRARLDDMSVLGRSPNPLPSQKQSDDLVLYRLSRPQGLKALHGPIKPINLLKISDCWHEVEFYILISSSLATISLEEGRRFGSLSRHIFITSTQA